MRLEILELVLWLVLELFGEVLLEVLFESGLSSVKEARGRENRDPVLATIGYLFLGVVLGGLSLWWLPERVLRPGPIPALSLVLSPLAVGAAMEWWGSYRRGRGHSTTNLATWHGGGALALGLAVVRYFGTH